MGRNSGVRSGFTKQEAPFDCGVVLDRASESENSYGLREPGSTRSD